MDGFEERLALHADVMTQMIRNATAGLCETPTGFLWVFWCWIQGVMRCRRS